MMKEKIMLPAFFAGILFLFATACSDSKEKQIRQSKAEKARLDSLDREALKVGVMPTLDCLPLLVAKDERLFDTLGVDVHLRYYSAQMDCDTALARKRVEGAVSDLVRAKHLQQKGTALVYPIATQTYWKIVSNKRARISELKQLSDKMIAITRYSATDYLATLAIDSVHPKYDVYRVQINDVRIRLKMLLNNEMDAALLPEPQATKAQLAGNKTLMDSRDKNLFLGVFAFRKDITDDKRRAKQLDLFLKAYNMAVDSINKNGFAKYAELISRNCDVDVKTAKALPRIRFHHAAPPRQHDLTVVSAIKDN